MLIKNNMSYTKIEIEKFDEDMSDEEWDKFNKEADEYDGITREVKEEVIQKTKTDIHICSELI